jgi:hypothetical protein
VPASDRVDLARIDRVSTQRLHLLRDCLQGGSPFLPQLTLAQVPHTGPTPTGPMTLNANVIAPLGIKPDDVTDLLLSHVH